MAETVRRWDVSDLEGRFVRRAWEALAADAGLLTRQGDPAHFTASALPITPDGSAVCLVLHRRIGLWVQPGGHFEAEDTTVTAAARREMEEETGLVGEIDVAPVLLSRHTAPCRADAWHLDIQMLAVTPRTPARVSEESLAAAWFQVDELPEDVASGVDRLVGAARQRLSRIGSPARPQPSG